MTDKSVPAATDEQIATWKQNHSGHRPGADGGSHEVLLSLIDRIEQETVKTGRQIIKRAKANAQVAELRCELQQARVSAQLHNEELEATIEQLTIERDAALAINESNRDGVQLANATLDAGGEAYRELEATIKRYEKAFRHTHEAKRVDGVLVDECGICGLDIREEIHERLADDE